MEAALFVETVDFISVCRHPSRQVNESVLRPSSVEPLSDLQLAEELIKQEMITMLHYDCLHHPSANAASQQQRGKTRGPTSTSNNASHIAHLETHSYKTVSTEEMEQVGWKTNMVCSCSQLQPSLYITINIFRNIIFPLSISDVALKTIVWAVNQDNLCRQVGGSGKFTVHSSFLKAADWSAEYTALTRPHWMWSRRTELQERH